MTYPIGLGEKSMCNAFPSRSTSSPNAVYVVFSGKREAVVDNILNIWYVKASCSNIGCDLYTNKISYLGHGCRFLGCCFANIYNQNQGETYSIEADSFANLPVDLYRYRSHLTSRYRFTLLIRNKMLLPSHKSRFGSKPFHNNIVSLYLV